MGVENRQNHHSLARKAVVCFTVAAELLVAAQTAGRVVDNHAQRAVGRREPTPKSCDDLSLNERLGYPKGSNPFVDNVVPGTPMPCIEIDQP